MDNDDGDRDDYLGSLEVHNMNNKDHVIWVSPEVQERVIKMELDTGSAVSVLQFKQCEEHFGHMKKIAPWEGLHEFRKNSAKFPLGFRNYSAKHSA